MRHRRGGGQGRGVGRRGAAWALYRIPGELTDPAAELFGRVEDAARAGPKRMAACSADAATARDELLERLRAEAERARHATLDEARRIRDEARSDAARATRAETDRRAILSAAQDAARAAGEAALEAAARAEVSRVRATLLWVFAALSTAWAWVRRHQMAGTEG